MKNHAITYTRVGNTKPLMVSINLLLLNIASGIRFKAMATRATVLNRKLLDMFSGLIKPALSICSKNVSKRAYPTKGIINPNPMPTNMLSF